MEAHLTVESPTITFSSSNTTPHSTVSVSISNGLAAISKIAENAIKLEKQTTADSSHTSNIGTVGKGGLASGRNSSISGRSLEEKLKLEPDLLHVGELLGSVTTQNCPGVRTSARVIQKMKQDSIRPLTPPPTERENKIKDEKNIQKTPSQMRANKITWTNLERNHFFDAVNEFGKDFEAIGNFINTKLKRKSASDVSFKTKDQVRQQYCQTFHKICKYVKFSEEVKKPAQELYALINYGEMRRKLQFFSHKHFMKLKHLIYNGNITIRCKGKNIRIKTPSCKALRKLNQLDDTLEDIRLPSKIEVIVAPANMESFGKVQSLAQNPKARTTVPLQKKLVDFIKTFQYKWRSTEAKLAEEETKIFTSSNIDQIQSQQEPQHQPVPHPSFQDPEICFMPKAGVVIHRPLLSITKYLSCFNLCLTAYEERFGVKVRGETLCCDKISNKRHRSDSGSEKRSPESKKIKSVASDVISSFNVSSTLCSVKEESNIKAEASDVCRGELTVKKENSDCPANELNEEISELQSDTVHPKEPVEETNSFSSAFIANGDTGGGADSETVVSVVTAPLTQLHTKTKKTVERRRGGGDQSTKTSSSHTFKPLISDEVLQKIRKGWTVSNAADITIGDLYVVFGHDSKLDLEYCWTDRTPLLATSISLPTFSQKQNGMPYNASEHDDPELISSLGRSSLGNKLKHLLLIANLSERIRKRQCTCGHNCEKATKSRIERDLATKSFISHKTFSSNNEVSNLFRQPVVPFRRPTFSLDPSAVKQMQNASRMKMSRQVVVQRLLQPCGPNQQYDVVEVKNLQNNLAEFSRRENVSEIDKHSERAFAPAAISSVFQNSTPTQPKKLTETSSNCIASIITNADTDTIISAPTSQQQQLLSLVPATTVIAPYRVIHHHQQVESQDLMEISMPSSLPDSAFDDCSNNSVFNNIASRISPLNIIRDSSSNSRWLEENLNDFSLTSLLGHLDEINANRDIIDPSSNLSVISETSVDYMTTFAEITASMQKEEQDL